MQQCLPYTDKIFIKSILDQIGAAKSPEDARRIKHPVVEIKQNIDNTLHIADIQIVKLVDELANILSTETVEAKHVNTEA